ncbi:hypothetical protein BDZ89DRAFT_42284 [Hymenopellis radicata]|nr:hypothetical protein BDZ89DRAFT_42284 [Hymenopellis radicata]
MVRRLPRKQSRRLFILLTHVYTLNILLYSHVLSRNSGSEQQTVTILLTGVVDVVSPTNHALLAEGSQRYGDFRICLDAGTRTCQIRTPRPLR